MQCGVRCSKNGLAMRARDECVSNPSPSPCPSPHQARDEELAGLTRQLKQRPGAFGEAEHGHGLQAAGHVVERPPQLQRRRQRQRRGPAQADGRRRHQQHRHGPLRTQDRKAIATRHSHGFSPLCIFPAPSSATQTAHALSAPNEQRPQTNKAMRSPRPPAGSARGRAAWAAAAAPAPRCLRSRAGPAPGSRQSRPALAGARPHSPSHTPACERGHLPRLTLKLPQNDASRLRRARVRAGPRAALPCRRWVGERGAQRATRREARVASCSGSHEAARERPLASVSGCLRGARERGAQRHACGCASGRIVVHSGARGRGIRVPHPGGHQRAVAAHGLQQRVVRVVRALRRG